MSLGVGWWTLATVGFAVNAAAVVLNIYAGNPALVVINSLMMLWIIFMMGRAYFG